MGSRSLTSTKLSISLSTTLTNTLEDSTKNATSQVGLAPIKSLTLTSGVKTGQANRAWENNQITITENSNLEINLATFAGQDIGVGAGNDAVGLAMDLQEIVWIYIENTSTELAGAAGGPFLEVMPATASGWTPIGEHEHSKGASIGAGGIIFKSNTGQAGFDVIPGTSERIRLTAKEGDVTCKIMILGRNDDDESSSTSSQSSSSSSSSSVSSSSVSSSLSSSLSSSST